MSFITASTSVVLVATSSATTSPIVYFPNINSSGRLITVRDNDGAATASKPIILSTIGTGNFVGVTNPILIAQPYGFVTLTSLPNGSYEVLNTFAFPPGQAVAYISNVTASTISLQQGIQFRDLLDQTANFLYTSSSQLLLNSTILGTVTNLNLQSTVIGLGSSGYISSYITPPQTSRIIAVGQTSNTVLGQLNPVGTRIFSDNNESWENSAISGVSGFNSGGTTIAYGANFYVAAGNNNSLDGANTGYLQWSVDGTYWQNSVSPLLNATQVRSKVNYANGLWHAVGSNAGGGPNTILYSLDGKSWRPSVTSNLFPGGFATGITYGQGIWVVSGSGGASGSGFSLSWSVDGSNWNPPTSVSWPTPVVNDVLYTGSNFVAIVGGLVNIAVSTDGKTWSTTNVTGAALNGAGQFLATGNGITLVTSLAAAGPGQLLKFSLNGGYNWQSNTDFTSGTLYRPFFDGITWWAGLNDGSGGQGIYYSFSGTSGWRNTVITGGFTNGGYPLAFTGSLSANTPGFQFNSTVAGLQNTLGVNTIQTNTLSTGVLTVANLVIPNFTSQTVATSSMTANFISTVVMDAGTLNVGVFSSESFKPLTVSTLSVEAGNGVFTGLVAGDISTTTLNVSTLSVSTLSGETLRGQDGYFSTINIVNISTGNLSLATATISSLKISYISSAEIYTTNALMNVMSANVANVSSLNTEILKILELTGSTINTESLLTSSLIAHAISSSTIYADYIEGKTGYFENLITSNITIEASFLSSLSTNYISSMEIYSGYFNGSVANISSIISLDLNSQVVTTGRLRVPYLSTAKVITDELVIKDGIFSTLSSKYVSSADIYTEKLYALDADLDVARISTLDIYDAINAPYISVENLSSIKISTNTIYTCTLYGHILSTLNMNSYLVSTTELTSKFINASFGNFGYVSSFKTDNISASKVVTSSILSIYGEIDNIISMTGMFRDGDFEMINASRISTGEIALGTAFISTLSTSFISSVDIYSGSINASQGNFDQLSTAALTLAVSFISCLSTTYISTLDLYGENANFTIGNFNTVSTGSLVIGTASISTLSSIFISTLDIYAGQIYGDKALVTDIESQNITSFNINTVNLTSESILTSTISSAVLYATSGTIDGLQSLTISSFDIYTDIIDGYQANFQGVSTQHIYAHSISTYNLVVYGANTLTVQGAANMTNLNTTDISVTNLKATNSELTDASIINSFTTSSMASYISSGQIDTSNLTFIDENTTSSVSLYVSNGSLIYTGIPFALTSNSEVTTITATDEVIVGINKPPYIPRTSILKSTDGYNWSNSVNNPYSEYATGITYSPRQNKWVAVGYATSALDSIVHSPDGSNWIPSESGGFTTIQDYSFGNGVAYDSTINMWVATGLHNYATSTIQSSTDGVNWTASLSGGFDGGLGVFPEGLKVIATQKGAFYAVGKHQAPRFTIQKSTNGRTWTPVASGGFNTNDTSPNEGRGIATNGSNFVAVGKHSESRFTIQYSTDGTHFVAATSGGFGPTPNSGGGGVLYSASQKLWVATGYGEDSQGNPDALKSIQTSTDGRHWLPVNSGGFIDGGYGVSYSSTLNTWITLGEGTPDAINSIQVSTDASNWTPANVGFGSSFDWEGIAGFDARWSDEKNIWIAVGTADKNRNIINYYTKVSPSNIVVTDLSAQTINAQFISAHSVVVYGSNTLIVQGNSELSYLNVINDTYTANLYVDQVSTANILISTLSLVDIETEFSYDLYVSDSILYFDGAPILDSNTTLSNLHVIDTISTFNLFADQISTANILISTLSLVDIETEFNYDLFVSDSILYFDGAPVLDSNVTLCNLYVIDTISTFNLFVNQISTANILISTLSLVDVETEFNYDLFVSDSILYFDGAPVLASNTTLCNLYVIDTVSTTNLFVDQISTANILISTLSLVDIETEFNYDFYVSDSILFFDGAPVLDSNVTLCNLNVLDKISTNSLFVYSGDTRVDGRAIFNAHVYANSTIYASSISTNNLVVFQSSIHQGKSYFNDLIYANSTLYGTAISTNNFVVYGTSTIIQGKSYFNDNMFLTSTFTGNAISANTVVVYGSSLLNAYLMSTPILFVSSINGRAYPIGIDSNIALCNILAVQAISTNNMLVYGSTFLNGVSFVNNIMYLNSTLYASSISTNNLVVYGSSIYEGKSYFYDILSTTSSIVLTSSSYQTIISPYDIRTSSVYTSHLVTSLISTTSVIASSITVPYVSATTFFVSSINGFQFTGPLGSNLALSNLTASTLFTNYLSATTFFVSSINGLEFTGGTSVGSNLALSNLTASTIFTNYMSATTFFVSSINGLEFTGGTSVGSNLALSNLTASTIFTNYMSATTFVVSSINGFQFTGSASVGSNLALSNLNTSSLFTNYLSSRTIIVDNISVGTITVFGPSTLRVQGSAIFSGQTIMSNLVISSINGSTIGSGGGSISSNIAVDTIDVNNYISLSNTTINGRESLLKSTDGSNWTNVESPFSIAATASYYSEEQDLWVATGYGDTPSKTLAYSTDGNVWSYANSGGFNLPLDDTSIYIGVCVIYDSNANRWLAGGRGTPTNTIQSSTDGRNWTNFGSANTSSIVNSIASGNSMYIAAGDANSANKTLLKYNGSTWLNATTGGFEFIADKYAALSVAYNGTFFLATGLALDSVSTIQKSADGVNWNAVGTTLIGSATAIAWGNSNFVVVDSTNVESTQRSTDGLNWVQGVGVDGVITSIAYSSTLTQWVAAQAIQSPSTMLYSTDGLNWTPSVGFGPSSDPTIYVGNGIHYNEVGRYWLASGGTSPFTSSVNQTLITSSNITTSNLEATTISLLNIVPGSSSSGYVAGGDGIQTSTDGSNWTATSYTPPSGSLVKALANNGSEWVGVVSAPPAPSGVNTMFISSDGSNYSPITSGGFDTYAKSVVYNGASIGDKWVAVGSDTTYANTIQSSTDGLNWVSRGNEQYVGFSGEGNQVISGPSGTVRFIAVGNNGENYQIYYSGNGMNWDNLPNPAVGFRARSVAIGTTNIVVVGSGSFIYRAPVADLPGDITWTGVRPLDGEGAPSFGNGANTIVFGNNKFVAGGNLVESVEPRFMIQLSLNGTLWENSTSHNFTTKVNSIVYLSDSIFIAVGTAGSRANTIQYSDDNGDNWLPAVSGGFTGLEGLGLSLYPGGIIAVGLHTSKLSQIQLSTDGSNWTPIASINGLYGEPTNVGYGNNRFIVTSSKGDPPNFPATDAIIHSTDSQNWTNSIEGGFNGGGYGIRWDSNTSLWYATGSSSKPDENLLSSTDGLTWTMVQANTVFNEFWSAVAYNGTTWVGVGLDSSDNPPKTIATSTDSLTWTGTTTRPLISGNNVLWDGTNWWVTGNNTGGLGASGLFTSTDANDNWSTVPAVTTEIISQIAYNGADYLAVGSNAIWLNSGGSWTKTIASGNYTGVVWNGSVWIVTRSNPGTDLQSIQYSTDGVTFEPVSSGGLTSAYAISYKNSVSPTSVTQTLITTSNITTSYVSAISISVSSINGFEFNGGGGSVSSNLALSNLAASTIFTEYASVTTFFVSSINGFEFNGSGGSVSSNLALSNLNTSSLFTNYLSSKTMIVDNISVGTITVFGPSTLNVQGSANFSKNVNLSNYNPGVPSTLIIAVGGYGGTGSQDVQKSTDGITWNAVALPPGAILDGEGARYATGVATNSSNWVIAIAENTTSNAILFSTDSVTWDPSQSGGTTANGDYTKVAYGNGYWFILGNSGVRYSPDGLNWTTISAFVNKKIEDIAYGNGLWVAVNFSFTTPGGMIQRSTDIINWSNSINGGTGIDELYSITWNGSYWLAGGYALITSNAIQKSTDAINWTPSIDNTTAGEFRSFAWNGSNWVAAGSGIQTSTDGLHWSQRTSQEYGPAYVTWTGTKFITSGNLVQSSTEGISWTSNAKFNQGYGPKGIATRNLIIPPFSTVTTITSSNIVTNNLQVTSINGTPFSGGSVSSNLALSNLTTSTLFTNYLSTTTFVVSSINGFQFTGSASVSSNLALSNLNTSTLFTNYVSTRTMFVSSINGYEFSGGGGGGSVSSNLALSNLTTSSLFTTNITMSTIVPGTSIKSYVAGGTSLQKSTDGSNWTATSYTPPSGASVKGLANNGSNWVGVVSAASPIVPSGSNTMFTSADGSNYSPITSGGFNPVAYSVAYNGSVSIYANSWVAVGRSDDGIENTIQSSTDGRTWNPITTVAGETFGGFSGQGFQVISLGVEAETQRFIAVGDNGSSTPIACSSNGIVWSEITNPGGGENPPVTATSVAIGANRVVMVATNGSIYSAPLSTIPAVTWWIVTVNNDDMNNTFGNGINTVTFGGGLFVAGGNSVSGVNSNYMIQSSSDGGSNWVSSISHNFSSKVNSIIGLPSGFLGSGINGFVAVGDAGTVARTIQYSTDAFTWVGANSGGFSSYEGYGLSLYPGGIIAVGSNASKLGQIQRSTDGSNWTPIASINGLYGQPNNAGYGNNRFIVTSSKGTAPTPSPTDRIIYSTDSQNWVNASTGGFTDGGYGITWDSNTSRWYATGADIDPIMNIQSSSDGVNWGEVTPNVVLSTYWSAVAYNGTIWVGVGSTVILGQRYTTFTSTDSINWNAQNTGFGTAGNNILWDGNFWWITGDNTNGAQNTGLYTSIDANDNWAPVAGVTSPIISQIAHNGSDYLAVGPDAIWRKLPGLAWSKTVASGNYTGVVWNGSVWIVTRSNPGTALQSIQYSADGETFTDASSGGFTSAYAISYQNLVNPPIVSQTTITSSNLIVNNLPVIPYAGFGTVTSTGPKRITLPYAYSNIPIVNLTVLNNYSPTGLTGSVFPQFVFLSSVTTTDFTVGSYILIPGGSFTNITGQTGATVNFTFSVYANNSGTSYPSLSFPQPLE